MGQTLTHGIYLPDEGERNCYNGLAGNWQLLDTSVGTIAEHSTQIAGKAPAVHTHVKADITDFPAYGNAAGTICEGNDSRLSDARTPVAHTHGNIANNGKLTNGNRAVITGSDKAITESSVTNTELGYLAGVTSAIQTQLNAKAADTEVVHKSGNETITGNKTFIGDSSFHNIAPETNNAYDLGSSSSQFKDTYTKGLYVDGNKVDPTLFPFMLGTTSSGGLFPYYKLNYDDLAGKGFNDLTDTGMYRSRTDSTVPNTPDAGTIDGILVVFNAGSAAGVSNNRRCRQIFYTFNTSPRTFTRYGVLSSTTGIWSWRDWVEVPTNDRSYKWNGTQYFLGTYLGNEYTSNYYTNFGIYGKQDTYSQSGMFITKYRPAVNQGEMTTSDAVQLGIDALENSVRTNNVLDIKATGYDSETGKFTVCDVVTALEGNLGTSDRPWKTINGLNPGALSLPDMSATGVDISSYIVYPTGEKSLNLSSGSNKYTASENGWLVIVKAVTACRYIKTVINTRLGAVTVPAASMSGSVYHCQPVPAGQTVSIILDCDSAPGLYFYPCLGNV